MVWMSCKSFNFSTVNWYMFEPCSGSKIYRLKLPLSNVRRTGNRSAENLLLFYQSVIRKRRRTAGPNGHISPSCHRSVNIDWRWGSPWKWSRFFTIVNSITVHVWYLSRSQWPRGLRHELSSLSRTLFESHSRHGRVFIFILCLC
jgi:hypothetical protein